VNIERSDNVVPMKVDQTKFAKRIADAQSEFELLDICGRIGSVFVMPFFSIFNLPTGDDQNLTDLYLTSNWPEFLIAEYDANQLLRHSPIISNLQASTEPLIYDIDTINEGRLDGNASFVSDLFKRHGIFRGVFFSVHLANGQMGAVSFSGSDQSLNEEKLVELHYLANLIYSKRHRVGASEEAPEFDLTKSELNCLRWTSQGKTSSEIAVILGLSEHTVNHYMKNASQKLDTSNRTHAVSKAIRLKIIT